MQDFIALDSLFHTQPMKYFKSTIAARTKVTESKRLGRHCKRWKRYEKQVYHLKYVEFFKAGVEIIFLYDSGL